MEHPKLSKGIYLLPNLFTTAGLFAGFYAIVAAMKGFFDTAGLAIFIAMIADSLDGRVARLMNAQSDFGAFYDSLSDVIAFGLAPALTLYSCSLTQLGKIGWLICFFYTAATALRLARFNSSQVDDKRYFKGLPCPPAAAVLASAIWAFHPLLHNNYPAKLVIGGIAILLAALMVSNLNYYSFKEFEFKGKVPFIVLLIGLLCFIVIAIDPPRFLLLASLCYALFGPLLNFRDKSIPNKE